MLYYRGYNRSNLFTSTLKNYLKSWHHLWNGYSFQRCKLFLIITAGQFQIPLPQILGKGGGIINVRGWCISGRWYFFRYINVGKKKSYNAVKTTSLLAWVNSWHFTTPSLVSPRNNVWETNAEIPYRWCVTTQIWVVLLIGWSKFSANQTHYQIWAVIRHQYGIFALISRMSFRRHRLMSTVFTGYSVFGFWFHTGNQEC